LLHRADVTLATLQQAMRDLALAAQRAPQIVHSVELGARDLPWLLTQTQQTAHQLEELAIQLRGLWLWAGAERHRRSPRGCPRMKLGREMGAIPAAAASQLRRIGTGHWRTAD
jgi:hypothetical protein